MAEVGAVFIPMATRAGPPDPDVEVVETWDDDCILLSAVKPSGKGKARANTPRGANPKKSSRKCVTVEDSLLDEVQSDSATGTKRNSLKVIEVDMLGEGPPPGKKRYTEPSVFTLFPSTPATTCTSSPSTSSPTPTKAQCLRIPCEKSSSSKEHLNGTSSPLTPAVKSGQSADCYIDNDYQLALKLNEELNGPSAGDLEFAKRLQEEANGRDCQVLADQTLAKRLQQQQEDGDQEQLKADLQLAKKLQEIEDQEAVKIIKATKIVVKQPPSEETSKVTEVAVTQPPSDDSTTSSGVHKAEEATAKQAPVVTDDRTASPMDTSNSYAGGCGYGPPWWTACPKCPPDAVRHYHLVEVQRDGTEWRQVAAPLLNRGFGVIKVQRIQNASLWQRFQSERQLMMQGRPEGFTANETLLYHTSRADKAIICEEGLDQRLSRAGNFGCGIYFSDDPSKCDAYSTSGAKRFMFGCCVLLGDTKVYPRGQGDQSLRREPLKPKPKVGEPKTYDSVQGNMSGQNEYVVYNTYRVLPEYLIEYQHGSLPAVSYHTSRPTSATSRALSRLTVLKNKLSKRRPPSMRQRRFITASLYAEEATVPSYVPPANIQSMSLLQQVQAFIDFLSQPTAAAAASHSHVPSQPSVAPKTRTN